MVVVNRAYKDSLFCHLFGSEKRKRYALELYNALAGTDYSDPSLLELTTIEGVVFLGYKNDVSFIIGDEMVLFEHQSTYSANMPLRGLRYFSKLFDKYVAVMGLDVYGTKLLRLPTPRYFVLYFGRSARPERQVLRLSDSFASGPGDLEVTATVLNCNEGSNAAIMEACEALRGYAHLLALARGNADSGMDLEGAVSAAVERCIREGALADYLVEHRAEVESMLFTIEDEERAMRVHWETVKRDLREEMGEELRREVAAEVTEQVTAEVTEQVTAEVTEQVTEQVTAEVTEQVTEQIWMEAARNLAESTGCGIDEAMDMLHVPEKIRDELAERADQHVREG